MKLTDSRHKDLIGEHFNHSMNWSFLDVVADVLNAVEDAEDEDTVYERIGDHLIYTKDQWEVFEEYCWGDIAEKSLNYFDDAYMPFCDDIISLWRKINKGGEDDE